MGMEIKIEKVINNNVVSALDERGREIIVTGKGIGFQKKAGDIVEPTVKKKVFTCEEDGFGSQLKQLAETTDCENMQLAEEIIELAKQTLGKRLNKSIYISLTDHLNYAMERQKEGIFVRNDLLWEIKRFYKPEYQIGVKALEMVKEKTGVSLPEDEAGFLAIHLLNAEMDASSGKSAQMPGMIGDILNIIKYTTGQAMDENSLSYERLVTHLKFLLQRVINGQVYTDIDEAMCKIMREDSQKEYSCALKIKEYLKAKMKFEISEEELMYLTMHIKRANRSEHKN